MLCYSWVSEAKPLGPKEKLQVTAPKKFVVILPLLAALVFGYFTCSTWSQSLSQLELDAKRVLWTDLSFQAKKLFVTVNTDVHLAPFSTAEFESLWLTEPKLTPLRQADKEIYHTTVDTIIDGVFSSPVIVTTQLWFYPRDASALHRIRLSREEDDFKKIYWFTPEGVHRFRREPNSKQEALLAPEQWTDVKQTFYSYDLTQLGCLQVSEPSLLIYILSAAEFSRNSGPLALCVFGKRQLHQVWLRPKGVQSLKVNYSEKAAEAEVRKKGAVEAIRVKLDAEPMKSDLEKVENFSFFGLRSDISIYLDPKSHIPIQINGKIPTVGSVKLKLREVRMKKSQ
jgi:hypothetical protein